MALLYLLVAFSILSSFKHRQLGPHCRLLSNAAALASTDVPPPSENSLGKEGNTQKEAENMDQETGLVDAKEANSTPTEIKVDGEPVALNDLGPIIINEDGTMRRIANWALLTPKEQEATSRRISARNKKRLENIKKNPPMSVPSNIDDNYDDAAGDSETLLLPERVPEPPVHEGRRQ